MKRLNETPARRRATRSKTGCLTCRKRKLKCDENRPVCTGCVTMQFSCDWPDPPNPGGTATKSISPGRQARASQHTAKGGPWPGQCLVRNRSPDGEPNMTTTNLRPALTQEHLECANSVRLSSQDRSFLAYFPSSTVYGGYGFGPWGTLQYIIQELAPSSSGIMRMILALSASEMHQARFAIGHDSEKSGVVDVGLHHYNLALHHLHDCLAVERAEGEEDDVECVIATIFFMVQYELRFSGSPARVKAHLQGLWALINSHPLFRGDRGGGEVPSIARGSTADSRLALSCQLILWLLYADVTITSAGASMSLLNLLSRSRSAFLRPSLLCRTARARQSRVWGSKYPPSQVLADMEIHRPVEFGHELLSLRFEVWHLRVHGEAREGGSSAAELLSQISSLREKYCDVFSLAEAAASMTWTQTMESTTRIMATYWALHLFHRRMLGDPRPPDDADRVAVDKLASLLFLHHEQEVGNRRQGRVVWPILMAAIETHDPIHRSWLVERLREGRLASTECEWAFSTAQEILSVQSAPGTPWVDLAAYMQSQD